MFEQVTTYKARSSDDQRFSNSKAPAEPDPKVPQAVGPPLSHSILVYSTDIINALQAVVAYYPSQDLSGDVLRIDWPYRVLVHHYDELVAFREQVMLKALEDLCVRERNASEHLKLLIQFLDETVMVDIRAEAGRNKQGWATYEHFWYSYRPGCVVVSNLVKSDPSDWDAMVVEEVSGGPSDSSGMWRIKGWNLGFDGTYLDRQQIGLSKLSFTGETYFISNTRFIYDRTKLDDQETQKKIAYGRRYWELIQKQCQHYKGKSCDFPYNEVSSSIQVELTALHAISWRLLISYTRANMFPQVDGLVMTDMKEYYTKEPLSKPAFIDRSDLRNWKSDCICSCCKQGNGTSPRLDKKDWSSFQIMSAKSKLTDALYLLCPSEIPAFVFRTRIWGEFNMLSSLAALSGLILISPGFDR